MRSALVFAAGFLSALLIVAGVGLWAGVKAQETWVVFNGLAQHLNRGSYCNNHLTKGIGLEQNQWFIGVYDNSNCRTSAYAGRSWLPIQLQVSDWRVRAGYLVAGVTGYAAIPLPAFGLSASFERERWGANLIFIPPMSESSVGVLWLQAKVRFR